MIFTHRGARWHLLLLCVVRSIERRFRILSRWISSRAIWLRVVLRLWLRSVKRVLRPMRVIQWWRSALPV